ncbi:MAG: hypothetical protein K2H38_03225 [Muribaculaceae bacterium]|nr:hypothetical protein [Muribaculaceae bacterium]
MPKVQKSYLFSHDIDWFFKHGDKLIHCASNGSILPDKANDNQLLRATQDIISLLPDIFSDEEIIRNQYYLDTYVNQYPEELRRLIPFEEDELINIHLSSFIAMAKKGFWSYDHIYDVKDNQYILVANPPEVPDYSDILAKEHPLLKDKLNDLIQSLDIKIDDKLPSLISIY